MSLANTRKLEATIGADFLQAYLECNDEIQKVIRELLVVLHDPNTTEEDCDMTISTLTDALFPSRHEGLFGFDLEETEKIDAARSEEMRKVITALNKEEELFAAKLRQVMQEKEITQQQLAEKLGIGQSAISNMLNRQCRPQRLTIERMANALEVSPQELWSETEPS